MREVKYRGKRIDNGELVFGVYVYLEKDYFYKGSKEQAYITNENMPYAGVVVGKTEFHGFVRVHPDSIGQSTGLKDKNDVEIYELEKT